MEEERDIKYQITRKGTSSKIKELLANAFVILESPSLFFQLSGREKEESFLLLLCDIKKGIIFNGGVIGSDVMEV